MFYKKSVDEVFSLLESSTSGLTGLEASKRLKENGLISLLV